MEKKKEKMAPNLQLKVHLWFARVASKEEVISGGKRRLEAQKKELVPLQESEVQSSFTEFASEKGSSMEKEKEATMLFKEVPL